MHILIIEKLVIFQGVTFPIQNCMGGLQPPCFCHCPQYLSPLWPTGRCLPPCCTRPGSHGLESVPLGRVSEPCRRNGIRPSSNTPLLCRGRFEVISLSQRSNPSRSPVSSVVIPSSRRSGCELGSTRTAPGMWLTLNSSSGLTS